MVIHDILRLSVINPALHGDGRSNEGKDWKYIMDRDIILPFPFSLSSVVYAFLIFVIL